MHRLWTMTLLVVVGGCALAAAAPLFDYSGIFPADRTNEATITHFLLLDKPKRLAFRVLNPAGQPLPEVRVVEVTSSSDRSVSHSSAAGLAQVDLVVPGIYEIKVGTTAPPGKEVAFRLEVTDAGPVAAAPATASGPEASTGISSPAIASMPGPVGGLGSGAPGQATGSPAPNATSGVEPPPVLNLPPAWGAQAPSAQAAPLSSPSEPVGIPVPASAVPGPASEARPPSDPGAATPSGTVNPAAGTPPTPAPVDSTNWGAQLLSPAGGGFANPFKPVEVRFDREIPSGVRLEDLVQVFHLDAAGRERPVAGSLVPSGPMGIRFIPTTYVRGAVFQVRVFDPVQRRQIGAFRFQTLPELLLKTEPGGDALRIQLSWPEIKDLLPAQEGQVVQLGDVIIRIQGKQEAPFEFTVTPDLPPFGNKDGIGFQGQPFQFVLTVPRARLPQTAPFEVLVLARITDVPQPLEVLRTTVSDLPGAEESLADVPADEDVAKPSPATPSPGAPLFAAATAPASPPPTTALATSPASPGTPAPVPPPPPPTPEPIVLKPVVPMADPGPRATLEKAGSFKVGEGGPNDFMAWPRGLDWGPDGSLWVTDSQNRRVYRFTEEGRLMKAFGQKGRGPGMLGLPIDLVVTREEVFVTDTAAHAVHVFSTEGEFRRTIGTWGTRPGEIDLPHGLFIASDQLVLADRGNARIMRFSLDGAYRGAFGTRGEIPGALNNPIAVQGTSAELFVLEEKGRLQRFSWTGKFLGTVPVTIREPGHMRFDPWGCLWIADSGANRVVRLDARGNVLLALEAGEGARPWVPTAVAIRTDGLVAVADGEGKLIRLYRLKAP